MPLRDILIERAAEITGLTVGLVAGVIGLSFLVRVWSAVRRGPGGDLTQEVVYLKGPDLVGPFSVLVAGLMVGVGVEIYWGAAIVTGQFPRLDLLVLGLALQSLLIMAGGFLFFQTLREFTPAARTNRRAEILRVLGEAVQSRGRILRRSKEP